jgi:hypothetical protein
VGWFFPSRTNKNLSLQVLRTAVFWVITQRLVVISYRRFGTTSRPILQMGSIGSHLLCGGSLTSSSYKLTGTVFGDGRHQILKFSKKIPKAVHHMYVNAQFRNIDKMVKVRSARSLEETG